MKFCWLPCKWFQLVDSMLFGQVTLAVLFGGGELLTYFSGKDGSAAIETRQLSYRKADRAMRPLYGCPENF